MANGADYGAWVYPNETLEVIRTGPVNTPGSALQPALDGASLFNLRHVMLTSS